MKIGRASENISKHTGYIAGPTSCPNCRKPNAKWMAAFTLDGFCECRVECDSCSLNMTHRKDFKEYPQAEWHYRRRDWNWCGEMSQILREAKDARSTIHSELPNGADTLLLPDNNRKLIGSD